MPTKANMTKVVAAPVNRMAELLRTALANAGFRIEFINDDMAELSASLSKSERGAAGTWSYEYHAMASWEPIDTGSKLDLEISEAKNSWTQPNCTTICKDLMQGVADRAAKLEKLDQSKPKPNRYGSAKWATHEDIVKVGYWDGHEDSRRLIISPGEDDNYVTLTPEDTVKHALVCGPTGSGKTSSVFIPNLIDRLQTSAIVTEATAGSEEPDLYAKTAGFRQLAGRQQIYYFNPDSMKSDRINPIDAVKTYAQAQAMAQLVIDNTTSKNNYGDDVWPKSEANLLTILIAHVAAEGGHLGQIRAMLREGPDGLVPVMAKSRVERARSEYRGFANNSREGFRYGVFAGLMQRLGLWVNPRIVALTETTDIDLDALSQQLFTFYLAVPAQKTHLKPVAALIFNFVLEQALEREFEFPLYLSLDEFTNFGFIPGLPEKLSIIRHRDIPVMLGFQDFSQVERAYGRDAADAMLSQIRCQIYFRPNTLDAAVKISKRAGMATEYDRKITSSGQIVEKEMGRALIDPSEVLALPEDRIIVFTPKTDPMLMRRFHWKDYEDAMSIKAIPKDEIVVDERLVIECEELKAEEESQEEPEAEAAPGEVEAKEPVPAEKMDEQKRGRGKFKKRKREPEREREPQPIPKAQPERKKEPEPEPEPEELDADEEDEGISFA